MSDRQSSTTVLFIVALASAVVLALPGCPRPLPPPEWAPSVDGGTCPAQPSPKTADLCAGEFTVVGVPCARCRTGGCLDEKRGVYCVRAGSCGDPVCGVTP